MPRNLIQVGHLVSSLKGVIARVMHRNTSAQVPVERVMNSTGLAPRPSFTPSQMRRARGPSESRNNPVFKYRIGRY